MFSWADRYISDCSMKITNAILASIWKWPVDKICKFIIRLVEVPVFQAHTNFNDLVCGANVLDPHKHKYSSDQDESEY